MADVINFRGVRSHKEELTPSQYKEFVENQGAKALLAAADLARVKDEKKPDPRVVAEILGNAINRIYVALGSPPLLESREKTQYEKI